MKTCKVHFIRNGFSQANVDGIYCGSTNSPLSHRGVLEINNILETYSYPWVEYVYTSTLDSDAETAELLFPDTETERLPGLDEMDFGIFEGRSIYELETDEDFQKWVSPNAGNFIPKGAEPPERFADRVLECIDEIIQSALENGYSSIAVVAHMGVIGTILSRMGLPRAEAVDWTCDHGFGYTAIADATLYYREPVIEVSAQIPVSNDSFERSYDDLINDDSWRDDTSLDSWMKE